VTYCGINNFLATEDHILVFTEGIGEQAAGAECKCYLHIFLQNLTVSKRHSS
jgi:hypothetical protein